MVIEQTEVVAVLLADGWHRVDKGTFEVGNFEFREKYEGEVYAEGYRGGPGFWYDQGDDVVAGCMSSLLAVRY